MPPENFSIVTTGQWRDFQIHSRWTPSTLSLPPDVLISIDRAWNEAIARKGVQLFDGPMCRLERFTATTDRLDLELSPTSYRFFFGTNMRLSELPDLKPHDLANPLGISVALQTREKHLILGLRNASVAYYPNRIHPFAGSLEPDDALDIFAAARRELMEEATIPADHVHNMLCLGIAQDNNLRQPEIIVSAETDLSSAQIAAQLQTAEHTDCIVIERNITIPNEHQLTPIAAATIQLWRAM